MPLYCVSMATDAVGRVDEIVSCQLCLLVVVALNLISQKLSNLI